MTSPPTRWTADLRCCANPKYLVGAAAVVGALAFAEPGLALPAAVALIASSCPVSMLLAMRGARSRCSPPRDDEALERGEPRHDEQIRALRVEIAQLREQRNDA
ncbi:hypothetical protein [Saccharopolyspora griseoalba]|uniref:DUF2933 domain-containing protein n=1 Tax=Saccharopolyspora griseoalba TaxID=1431848 RepID=A0ABW2LBP8_9PSEU